MNFYRKFFGLFLISLIFSLKSFAVVVYWEPAVPVPGGTVTIYYNVSEGTLPDDTNPVYIHLGYNGWTNVNDYAMSQDTAAGWWKYQYQIPTDCEVIDFVFTDLKGNWDNNGGIGIDWHISLNYSWEPLNPNPNDSIKITIRNSSQGGAILWYVQNNDRSMPPIADYWPRNTEYTTYRDAVESPLEGPDGQGNYYLYLGPFYNPKQFVEKVKFKIHWADDTWENSLFEIEMDYTPQEGDPVITFVSPDSGQEISGATDVSVTVDEAETVELWAGVDSLASFTDAPYQATWEPSVNSFGPMYVTAKATNADGRVTIVRRPVYVQPQVVSEPVPEGVKDGVNVNGNTVTFVLYAPAKSYISLKGNFNTEYPNGELMKLSGDTLWWLTKTLDDGVYLYQYDLEGEKVIADPWSKNVRWKNPGTEEESTNYEHAFTEFTVGGVPFNWSDDSYRKPDLQDLVVYELYIRDFGGDHPGTYADVRQKLEEGYFDSLGVNAIEFMPITEFPGSISWGYNPAFDLAPESTYGTPEELKELINAFHQHDIAVLLDVVYNHMDGTAPLFQLYQPKGSWDRHDHDYAHCPYFHDMDSEWFYKLQHWKYADGRHYRTWRYVSDALQSWVQDYHVDGFRFDASWGIGWDGYNNNGMSYYSWFLRQMDSTQYVIVEEDFYSGTNQVNVTEADANWHFRYYHQMKANLTEKNDGARSWGDMNYTSKVMTYNNQPEGPSYTEPTGMLNYIESHDETRIVYETMHYYPYMSREKAIKKSKLGATVLLTGQGIPMLYHGQEFGQDGAKNGTDPQPLMWSYLDNEYGSDLFNYYRRMIWYRKNHPEVKSPNLKFLLKDTGIKTMAYQYEEDGQYTIVVVNFDNTEHSVTIAVPSDGAWFEFTNDDTVYAEHGSLSDYTVPGSTARVLSNNKDWPTGLEANEPVITQYELYQNFPNPFNPATQISYRLAKADWVKLTVYNALGQVVKELVNGHQTAGDHKVAFDASGLASGVYIYRIQTSTGFTAARKMLLLR